MGFEFILVLGSYAGSVVTAAGLITLIVKPLRERFVKWISSTARTQEIKEKLDALTELVQTSVTQNEELKAKIQSQSEAIKAGLRDSILNTYRECMERQYMTNFERQNLTELYENYKALGGNSFIDECVERLKALDVHTD